MKRDVRVKRGDIEMAEEKVVEAEFKETAKDTMKEAVQPRREFDIGIINKVKLAVEDLFFLTRSQIISKDECGVLLNGLRSIFGFVALTPEEFEKRFSAPQQGQTKQVTDNQLEQQKP